MQLAIYSEINRSGAVVISASTVRAHFRSKGYSGKELTTKVNSALREASTDLLCNTVNAQVEGLLVTSQRVGTRRDGRKYISTVMEEPKMAAKDKVTALEVELAKVRAEIAELAREKAEAAKDVEVNADVEQLVEA